MSREGCLGGRAAWLPFNSLEWIWDTVRVRPLLPFSGFTRETASAAGLRQRNVTSISSWLNRHLELGQRQQAVLAARLLLTRKVFTLAWCLGGNSIELFWNEKCPENRNENWNYRVIQSPWIFWPPPFLWPRLTDLDILRRGDRRVSQVFFYV